MSKLLILLEFMGYLIELSSPKLRKRKYRDKDQFSKRFFVSDEPTFNL